MGLPLWTKTLLGIVIFGGLLTAMIFGSEFFNTQKPDNESSRFHNMSTRQRADMKFDNRNYVGAAAEYKKLVESDAFNSLAIFRLAYCLHRQKQYDESIKLYQNAMDYNEVRLYAAYNMACIYAVTNKLDESIASLRMAIDGGFATREGIDNDNDLSVLYDDPEFQAIAMLERRNKREGRSRR